MRRTLRSAQKTLRSAHKQMVILPLLIVVSLAALCSSALAQASSCIEVHFTDKTLKLAILAFSSGSYVAAADAYKDAHYRNSVVIYRADYKGVGGDFDDYDIMARKVWYGNPDIAIVCSDTPDRWRKELTARH
jgi:hypothetical protein